jgi:hypothetical protein
MDSLMLYLSGDVKRVARARCSAARSLRLAALGVVPQRRIYDIIKIAVDRIGRGKTLEVNARWSCTTMSRWCCAQLSWGASRVSPPSSIC